MSAQSLQVVTFDFPNPDFTPIADSGSYHRIPANISFTYVTSFTLRSLSTKGADPGITVSGLLFVPDLPSTSRCNAAAAAIVPQNVTRRSDLPSDNYYTVALAPWLDTPECVQEYLASIRGDPAVRGLITFLPNDTSNEIPPQQNSPVWDLQDGGSWKRQNDYPVYAIPGQSGTILLDASAQYSGNMTSVPYGHELTEMFDSRDYVRLLLAIDTSGANELPSLWLFLLVVLGILMAVIGLTSFSMHYLQYRRRQLLRRRIANGEVDLEALGIKRLTVTQEILDGMPMYIYGSGTPVLPEQHRTSVVKDTDATAADKNGSITTTRTASPTDRATTSSRPSFQPTTLHQPACAICLDDFIPAPGSSASTSEPPAPSTTEPSDDPEALAGTTVRQLPCAHIFHPACVDPFLRETSSLCPLCKKSVLPKGYCPRVVTNAMVRRERMVRRIRERVVLESDGRAEAQSPARAATARQRWLDGMANFVRPSVAFSGFEGDRSNRIVIRTRPAQPAPEPMLELRSTAASAAPPAPAAAAAEASLGASAEPLETLSRRERARRRAIAMLGRGPAPLDPDAEEARATPGWKKVIRAIFPSAGAGSGASGSGGLGRGEAV